jgi:hypothetical protein
VIDKFPRERELASSGLVDYLLAVFTRGIGNDFVAILQVDYIRPQGPWRGGDGEWKQKSRGKG